jgi:hypothetical protein
VLVSPSLEYRRLKELLPGLRKALDRGVQLVVMWGRSSGDALPERVGTLLDELQQRPGAQVVRAPCSTRTEACLLIQDDCRALVGSRGVLGRQSPGPREASVLIEPAEGGPVAPRAITDLLSWARTEFPRWALGQRIKVHSGDFDGPVNSPATSGGQVLDEQQVLRIDTRSIDDDNVPLWAASWVELHSALVEIRGQIEAKDATVEVVRDGEHRALLWEGLRGAGRRLVIADDRVDPRTATASMARAIRERQHAGATVHLIHPEIQSLVRSADSFAALKVADPEPVSVRRGRDSGRVVVCDDEVMIGSFSPLGDVRDGQRGRGVTHVGLRIRDEAFAASLAAFLGAATAAEPDKEPAVTRTARSSSARAVALPLLVEAGAATGWRAFGRTVVERLAGLDEPWAVLSMWAQERIPRRELRTAAAAMLHAGVARDQSSADRWVRWLVEDAWERGAFVEGALLARRLAGRPGALDNAAVVAAALEVGPLGDVASEAALELLEHPAGPQAAGAAGAVAEVLLWGGPEGSEALGLLASALPATWAELVPGVRELRSAPVPMVDLIADQTQAELQRRLEQRLRNLIEEIDKIELLRARFDFATGQALHLRLFASDGLLSTIRSTALDGVPACLDLSPILPTDVRGHLDDLIAEAGEKPMEWHRQVHFLHKVEDIVRSVRVIMAGASRIRLDDDEPRLMPDVVDLGGLLAVRREALLSEATAIGRPWELPMTALLDRLNPLVVWARERL